MYKKFSVAFCLLLYPSIYAGSGPLFDIGAILKDEEIEEHYFDGIPFSDLLPSLFQFSWSPDMDQHRLISRDDVLGEPSNVAWLSFKKLPQEAKDFILDAAYQGRYQYSNDKIAQKYRNVMCAIAIGAHPGRVRCDIDSPFSILEHKIMLKKLNDVRFMLNQQFEFTEDERNKLLFFAYTTDMAQLLIEYGACITENNQQELLKCVVQGILYQPELIGYYAQRGLDVNMPLFDSGATALHSIAGNIFVDDSDVKSTKKNIDKFDQLIKAGADINLQDDEGRTCLGLAFEMIEKYKIHENRQLPLFKHMQLVCREEVGKRRNF